MTTDLTGAGVFNVYNDAGSVDLIIDINGYYTKASLTELASRLTVAEAGIAANGSNVAALDAREPFAVTARDDATALTPTADVVVSVTVTAPAAGHVTVNSTTNASHDTVGDDVWCSINAEATPPAVDDDTARRGNRQGLTDNVRSWRGLGPSTSPPAQEPPTNSSANASVLAAHGSYSIRC